jgi:predicted MFS family arabinose efflux permease
MTLFWFALMAFAIGTEGFVIAGLLPIIASDLHISVPATGQLVTAYGFTYAIASPVLSVAFNNVDRKVVMSSAIGCFIAGNVFAVIAQSFTALMFARILMAVGASLVMPTANAVAVAISSPERRGRAISLVTSGVTVATLLGLPLGTMVGHLFGWRYTFVMVAVLGTIALVGILLRLPRGLPRATATFAQRVAVLRRGAVLHALATMLVWAAATFNVFAYLALPLKDLGFGPTGVSFALLVFGVAAFIGNLLGGMLADRFGASRTATLALAVLILIFASQSAVLKFAPAQFAGTAFIALIFCWAIAGWSFYTSQIANLVQIEKDAPAIAMSLGASSLYLGIAVGGAVGGIVVSALQPSDLGWISGCTVAVAFSMALMGRRQMQVRIA